MNSCKLGPRSIRGSADVDTLRFHAIFVYYISIKGITRIYKLYECPSEIILCIDKHVHICLY